MIDTETDVEYWGFEWWEKVALGVFAVALADYRYGKKLINKHGSIRKTRTYIKNEKDGKKRRKCRYVLKNCLSAKKFLNKEITLWHDIIGLKVTGLTTHKDFLDKKPKLTEYYRRLAAEEERRLNEEW